ncbi:NusG domain II-containing protein [Romboutsia weinsteinii]|uniref:NusG domain II-containing protein n=1 Tax=Romboutsia weinsteinii TaxID=2020949 RepID=A0A371IY59_9FIRM|nr:NusG domain II-containing protein [Romboutsia weinsteinii]RDY25423.1 NusG domain II-containing protein [Romboutsia weinsteinii]
MKTFKKLDFVIIVFLIILSFIPHFIFAKTLAKSYTSTYANIKVSGKLYKNINLSSFKGEKTLVIPTSHGTNTVLIKDNTIQIIEADCNDALCIKQGVISKVGENLICLPHELIIEIKGDESDSSSDMILSH